MIKISPIKNDIIENLIRVNKRFLFVRSKGGIEEYISMSYENPPPARKTSTTSIVVK